VNAFIPRIVVEQVQSISLMMPRELQWPVFALLVVVYVFLIVKLLNFILCWLDYAAATALRRVGSRPLAVQYAVGNVLEVLPRWVVRVGVLFVLVTLSWSAVAYGLKPADDSALMWFQTHWGRVLRALWG
jgi:hypothetical protein